MKSLYFIALIGLLVLSIGWFMRSFIRQYIEKLNKQLNEVSAKNIKSSSIDVKEEQMFPPSDSKMPLSWLTSYDKRRGTPNSIFFNETLNKAINRAKRRNKLLALLLVDIHPTNATPSPLAQPTNELLFKEIEKKLTNTLRNEDVLVQSEDNVFSILLDDIGKAKFASAVANKLLHVCSQPLQIENNRISLITHIGVCIYPTEGGSLEDLRKNADIALSKAKNAGANAFRFYTQGMDAEASEYIHMEKSLRKAITNNEFTLYYQPKFHLKTGQIARLEALTRWIHPEIGIIHPEKFLPIAEETGLIHPMGEWALREACRTTKQWQEAGYAHMPIAVNLSPQQFYHPEIVQIIAAVLNDTGLNPNYLELEVTETAIMDNADKATTILADIKATGVQISIDHFGTGYFSISQLKQFPLTLLKIDQSFIKGIPNNPNDSAITMAIIALAHHLGLEVVAEGVETAEQVQYLSAQNCDMVQGYFLSPPLPEKQIMQQFDKLSERVLL